MTFTECTCGGICQVSRSWGRTPLAVLLTHRSHAWARWKSQSRRMHEGWTLPMAFNSPLLLSVIEKWGDQFGFHFFSTHSPSVRSSSLSYWGIIVATTLPIPRDVFTVTKKHGNPYLVLRYTLSISVTTFPYLFNSFCWCFVCMTRRNVVVGVLAHVSSPSSSPSPVTMFPVWFVAPSYVILLMASLICSLRADLSGTLENLEILCKFVRMYNKFGLKPRIC